VVEEQDVGVPESTMRGCHFFLVTIPQSPSLAAICLPDEGSIFPSKPLVKSSTTSAMADSRESRPPDTVPKRSPSQTAARAQQGAALTHASVGEGGPPVVVQPVASPVPKQTAETAESAQRRRLALAGKAGPPEEDLLITRPPEEGGGATPRLRVDSTGQHVARAASRVRNLGPKALAATTGATTTPTVASSYRKLLREKPQFPRQPFRSRVGILEHHRRV
jgi:hypothetical protein